MNKTDNKEYIYYWYHCGLVTPRYREIINGAAVTHDWETFRKYVEANKNKGDFPDTISVHDDESNYKDEDDYIEHGIWVIPLNEENFKLITWAECEWG